MQYNASFLLYQLWYPADYEDWATVENAISWSHKANNSPFCIMVQLQWVILKCRRTPVESGRKTGFHPKWESLDTLPSYTPNLQLLFVTFNIWNWFLSGRMLLDQSLRPLGGTRIWTQNSKYRIKKFKATIATTFFPPGPLKTHLPELKSAWSTVQAKLTQ